MRHELQSQYPAYEPYDGDRTLDNDITMKGMFLVTNSTSPGRRTRYDQSRHHRSRQLGAGPQRPRELLRIWSITVALEAREMLL